jgi:hypothetical protein
MTGRSRAIVGAVALLLVAGTGIVVARTLLAGSDCQVRVGDRSVDLTQAQAEAATTALAPRERSAGLTATAAVRRVVPGLSAADATVVSQAVTGRAHAALWCRSGGASTSAADGLDARGLTARAEQVRDDLLTRFGDVPLGGYAPGGVHSGHMPGSAHYEGRAIDVFFRPIDTANKTRGWALAQYFVANARRLTIATVIFDDEIWTADQGDQGWRHYVVPETAHSASELAILQHRDHVHVDVPR